MNMIKMTKPQCSIYSLAIALDEKPQRIIEALGHDGLKEKDGILIGIHITELQIAALKLGWAGVLLGTDCYLEYAPLKYVSVPVPTYEYIMSHDRTVLMADTHAYATDGNIVYDPNGREFDLRINWLKEFISFGLILFKV